MLKHTCYMCFSQAGLLDAFIVLYFTAHCDKISVIYCWTTMTHNTTTQNKLGESNPYPITVVLD